MERSLRRSLATFAVLWLATGFCLGTSTLLGPVRWVAAYGRRAGWPEGAEDAAVTGIIGLLVAGTALLAVVLTRVARRSGERHVRIGLPVLVLLAALASVALWLDPAALGADMGRETRIGTSFTIGPYPTLDRMKELKARGYTAIVTLLHPAVVPFEPKLLADERAAAREAGIELIEAPMLPWIADNAESLAKIERLAREGRGKYYVHCYLGRDRVHMVRQALEETAASLEVSPETAAGTLRLEEGTALERGAAHALGEGSFLTPLPTDDELVAFVLPGEWTTVVSLLDPANPDDRPWIEREREALSSYGVPFRVLPLDGERPDPGRVREIVREVRALPPPVLVHAFLGPSTGKSPAAAAFLEAWNAAGPPERSPSVAPAPDSPSAGAGGASLVPDLRTIVVGGPPMLLFAGLAAWLAGWLRAARGVRTPYTRKVFHFAVFSTAAALRIASGLASVALFGAIVTLVVLYATWRGEGFPFYEAMARPSDAPHRTRFVLVPLATTAVGGLTAGLLFGPFASVGYLVGGWGDAVGEPVGAAIGRHRYRVPSLFGVSATRSVEGSAAVVLAGMLAAFVALALSGFHPAAAAGAAVVVGLLTGAVEAVSHHGIDNFAIQVVAAASAWLML